MGKSQTVLVVGGGIGGLCTAARLAKQGYDVTLVEKEDKVGGRANRLEQDGYIFDMGPTLLMMTEVLYETFEYCGKNLNDYMELIQLEPNYQVIFGDSSSIRVSSNLPSLYTELSRFDPKAPEQFYRYFADVAEFYRIARKDFIDRNFDRMSDFVNITKGYKLFRKGGLGKLYSFVGRYFDDERLKQLFSFQSMYLGVSPYDAPAIYSTVSYMETGLGIWYPKGGMYSLSLALEKLCKDMGVAIKTRCKVDEITIRKQRAVGVNSNGKSINADLVVVNADLVYAYQQLVPVQFRPKMPDSKLRSYTQASSALLFYFGVNHALPGLLHHNVLLSKEFKKNFDEIFFEKVLPNDPSFYLYIPTKTDPSLAPKSKHVLYILVPVPNLEASIDWSKAQETIKKKVFSRIQKEYGFDLTRFIESSASFTPDDFKTKFNLYNGSAFGLSHTFFQTGYFRPHNYSQDIKGLYFVGASTYPGGGIPMVTLSAKLVVERIQNETQH